MSIAELIKIILRPIKLRLNLIGLEKFDKKIFLNGVSPNTTRATLSQISGHLLLYSHGLEKALTKDGFQGGHSSVNLNKIRYTLDNYERLGYSRDCFAYKYALTVLHEYISEYEKRNISTDYLKNILGKWFDESRKCNTSSMEGYKVISKNDKSDNSTKSFREILLGRYSVREYADDPVDLADLKCVVELARKTPSVCNRQGVRVRAIVKKETIRDVLAIQTGFKGYKLPPALYVVTVDNSVFVSGIEHNQGYIDGGLFSMSMLLALESKSLASCALNAELTVRSERKIRKILNLSSTESLIMFIAVGKFKKETKVANSDRVPVDEILQIIE